MSLSTMVGADGAEINESIVLVDAHQSKGILLLCITVTSVEFSPTSLALIKLSSLLTDA